MNPSKRSDISRWVANVAVMHDDCWMWRGYLDRHGYGQFGRAGLAHRAGYMLLRGPIPDGYVLDHLCDTPQCVNPWHLEIVTQHENILRGSSPAAHHARKTKCAKGHPLVKRSGKRVCLECQRESSAEYRRRRDEG